MNSFNLFSAEQQLNGSSIAPLDLAEQHVHQLIAILGELTTVLLDAVPDTQLAIKDLAGQYWSLVTLIKLDIVSIQKQPSTMTFAPMGSTAHNDWLQSDLSSLMVLNSHTAVGEMLMDLDGY